MLGYVFTIGLPTVNFPNSRNCILWKCCFYWRNLYKNKMEVNGIIFQKIYERDTYEMA